MKFPDPRFKHYWFVLRRESDKLRDGDELWGKRIQMYEPTGYDFDYLQSVNQIKRTLVWNGLKNDRRVEIWGELVEGGRRVAVSPWLIEEERANELRRAGPVDDSFDVDASDLRGLARRIRDVRARRPGGDRLTKQEIAYFARREMGLTNREALELLKLSGESIKGTEQVSWLVRNMQSRIGSGQRSRLCGEIGRNHEKS